MATPPPTNLEDTQEPPADQPPTQSLGPTLDSLTAEQLSQDCKDILADILQEVVVCSEAGVHGPNGPETSCVSATCSLGGVSPPQDITLALANLVSNNQRYRRKCYFNCGQCTAVIRNTTSCHCGHKIDFPTILFKKCFTKSLAFFSKLEVTSNHTTTDSPKNHVSLHRWARYLLSSHGVMFTGLLDNATGLSNRTSCSCFQAQEPDKSMLETEQDESLALNVSGSLFHSHEVGKLPKQGHNFELINPAQPPARARRSNSSLY